MCIHLLPVSCVPARFRIQTMFTAPSGCIWHWRPYHCCLPPCKLPCIFWISFTSSKDQSYFIGCSYAQFLVILELFWGSNVCSLACHVGYSFSIFYFLFFKLCCTRDLNLSMHLESFQSRQISPPVVYPRVLHAQIMKKLVEANYTIK